MALFRLILKTHSSSIMLRRTPFTKGYIFFPPPISYSKCIIIFFFFLFFCVCVWLLALATPAENCVRLDNTTPSSAALSNKYSPVSTSSQIYTSHTVDLSLLSFPKICFNEQRNEQGYCVECSSAWLSLRLPPATGCPVHYPAVDSNAVLP